MANYRIYCLNTAGHIASSGDCDSASDKEACGIAAHLLKPGERAEIWKGILRVGAVSLASVAGVEEAVERAAAG
jgi:hypothetical protein